VRNQLAIATPHPDRLESWIAVEDCTQRVLQRLRVARSEQDCDLYGERLCERRADATLLLARRLQEPERAIGGDHQRERDAGQSQAQPERRVRAGPLHACNPPPRALRKTMLSAA
jgi:hypothetical protein